MNVLDQWEKDASTDTLGDWEHEFNAAQARAETFPVQPSKGMVETAYEAMLRMDPSMAAVRQVLGPERFEKPLVPIPAKYVEAAIKAGATGAWPYIYRALLPKAYAEAAPEAVAETVKSVGEAALTPKYAPLTAATFVPGGAAVTTPVFAGMGAEALPESVRVTLQAETPKELMTGAAQTALNVGMVAAPLVHGGPLRLPDEMYRALAAPPEPQWAVVPRPPMLPVGAEPTMPRPDVGRPVGPPALPPVPPMPTEGPRLLGAPSPEPVPPPPEPRIRDITAPTTATAEASARAQAAVEAGAARVEAALQTPEQRLSVEPETSPMAVMRQHLREVWQAAEEGRPFSGVAARDYWILHKVKGFTTPFDYDPTQDRFVPVSERPQYSKKAWNLIAKLDTLDLRLKSEGEKPEIADQMNKLTRELADEMGWKPAPPAEKALKVPLVPQVLAALRQEGLSLEDIADLVNGKASVAEVVARRLQSFEGGGGPDHARALEQARMEAVARIESIVKQQPAAPAAQPEGVYAERVPEDQAKPAEAGQVPEGSEADRRRDLQQAAPPPREPVGTGAGAQPDVLLTPPAAEPERIVATAVRNPATGQIVSGRNKIHVQLYDEVGLDPVKMSSKDIADSSGYLTSKGRFVTQDEGQNLAVSAGQIFSQQELIGEMVKDIAPPAAEAAKPTAPSTKAGEAAAEALRPGASIASQEEAFGGLVRDRILNAPSFPKLVAAAKSFKKSLGTTLREDWEQFVREQPWDLLTAHSGVMNAKSALAKTLKSLADAVIKEAGLPMMPAGRYRGMDYQIDWRKVAESAPPTPGAAAGGKKNLKQIREELDRGAAQEGGFINPSILNDILDVGRDLYRKGIQFEQWVEGMIGQFGRNIAGHLQTLWNRILSADVVSKLPLPVLNFVDNFQKGLSDFGWRILNNKPFTEIARSFDALMNTGLNLANAKGNSLMNSLRRAVGEAVRVKPMSAEWWTRMVRPTKSKLQSFQEALTFVRESGENLAVIRSFRNVLAAAQPNLSGIQLLRWQQWQQRALRAIDVAENYFAELSPVSREYKAVLDNQIAGERAAGKEVPYRENYVPHVQDFDLGPGADLFGHRSPLAGTGVPKFRKMRDFQTFTESLAAGRIPESLSAIDLAKMRMAAGNKMIGHLQWLEGLKHITETRTGNPVAVGTDAFHVKEVTDAAGNVHREVRPPAGYTEVEFGGQRLGVLNGFEPYFHAFTDASALAKTPTGHAILTLASTGKHSMLLFDTFHMARLGFWAGIMTRELTHPSTWLKRVGYKHGMDLLNYTAAELDRMTALGEITPEYRQQLRQMAPYAKELARQGLNAAGFEDNLYSSLTQMIPGFGRFNQWLFSEYARGIMVRVGVYEMQRVMRDNPNLSMTEAAKQAATTTNTRLGNLQNQSWLKSRTFRDIARLLFLAPGWNEGLIRSELGAIGQAVKLPVDVARGRPLVVGGLLRAAAGLTVTMFALNQLVNMLTRGKPTWENEEQGLDAKMSAWLPDPTGTSAGYMVSPVTLPFETAHLIGKRLERTGNMPDAVRGYTMSRLGYLGRIAQTALYKRDVFDRPIPPQDYWKDLGLSAVPVPISGGAALNLGLELGGKAIGVTEGTRQEFAGQYGKQALASLGVKTESAPGAHQTIARLAAEWNRQHGVIEFAEHTQKPYTDLDRYLRIGNWTQAIKEYRKLLQTQGEDKLDKRYKNMGRGGFIHRTKGEETEFYESLTPQQQFLYDKAMEERELLGDLYDLLKRKI